MPVTQPLRDEHKELIPHIEALGSVGTDSVGYAPVEAVRQGVDEAYQSLIHHLIRGGRPAGRGGGRAPRSALGGDGR